MRPETRVGYDFAHAIVDDHSRLAYVELHDDEKAATVASFVERALSLATRAYLLVEGRVATEGLSAELRQSDAVRAAVLGT
jgi:ABC-type branched-subunit amino acid transport system ATPase component